MRSKNWNKVLAGILLAAPMAHIARAEIYLTEDQAANILFPGIRLEPTFVDLSPAQMKAIQTSSGERVLSSHIRIFWGPNHEALVIDQVVGKHEFIQYAVAISSDGKIRGVEIMDYRETYGYQVREARWRKQFVGKTLKDSIRVDKDIQNISGATLSCVHVTNGIRRVLSTYEILTEKS